MLKQLHLSHFRSYSSLELELSEQVLLILGPNATGKTNILEAMYVAATGRSFRGNDEELVQHSAPGFRVDATHDDEVITITYQATLKKKTLQRDAVRLSRATLLGRHPVVLFEPNDLLLLSGPPERRRRYLDLILAQTDSQYRRELQLYKRLLRQRNALLWRNRRDTISRLDDQLFILETQMAEPAENISQARVEFIRQLTQLLNELVGRISERSHSLAVHFTEKSSDILTRYQERRERDIVLGTTSVGPHREDWTIEFDSHPLTATASRGEVRTTLLALKLAELDYVRAHTQGGAPTLLLDDVFSELDEARRRALIRELDAVQTIITSTDIDRRLKLPAQTLDLTRPSS